MNVSAVQLAASRPSPWDSEGDPDLSSLCLSYPLDHSSSSSSCCFRQYGLRQNDGQALSLYGFPATRFTLVYVEYNYVKTNDEAFEVLGNHPQGNSRIVFRENEIDSVYDVSNRNHEVD